MRVHYGPHEKIPAHDHTERAAAYVYLNDGGPVIFKHIGLDYGPVTRPATKAGSFRLYNIRPILKQSRGIRMPAIPISE